MKRRQSLLISLIFILMIPTFARAQQWSGIIDPSRAINWSNAGVPGGIPTRTTICATLNPGATAAQISSAIQSCPSGQVVSLSAGTYNLSTGIDFRAASNVTLRGTGPDQTFLIFTGDVGCGGLGGDICVMSNNVGPGSGIPVNQTANWTAGYAMGITQITLDNTAGLQAGTIIVLDQLDDSTDGGTIYECQTQNVCGNDRPAGSGRNGRGQEQFVKVSSVNGRTVTITPGLYMPNWRSGQSPGAWWAGSAPIQGDGVENLSVDHSLSTSGQSGIYFFNAYGCWVKNVRSLNARQNHVYIYQSSHITVRDSYFYGTQNAATNSYGVETYMGGDSLVENNIFQHIVSGTVSSTTSGSVFAYNYSIDDHYTVASWMMAGHWEHAIGDDMLLWEGNEGPGYIADNVHGTHHFGTLFRNQFTGFEKGKSQQTIAVHLYTHSRYFNVVGNVLGTAGYNTNYSDCYGSISPCITTSDGKADFSIYTLGWCGNEGTNTQGNNGCGSSMVADANVATTLMRWGNYDTANAAVQWNSSEVPNGLSQYANPVPSNHNLPVSFYLSSKPIWWGTMPWPATGPDVTGGNDPTGYSYANPAQVCYNNSPIDRNYGSSNVLLFNAATCYSSAARPAPPTSFLAN